jgi:OOP family OmpA-OmpF porin
METELLQNGYAVLSDLDYETGSAQLGAGPFQSLKELADFMKSQPTAEIIMVGHTDNTGASDANIALSKRRAASVVERLVTKYGIAAKRLSADGVGFLAPLTANTAGSGREQNRRVEAVIKRLQ